MPNQKSTEIIYLELDINQTEKRFRQYAKDYNKELLNPDFLNEQFLIHQKYNVPVKETRKSLMIKSNTITVTIAIIKAYFSHLRQIEQAKLTKEPIFTMNNKAIASMTGMCDRSSRRHVNKLLATGFLNEKIFRGTNAAFVLNINPEFLVARPNKKLSDLLISQHIGKYPGMPMSPITYKHYNSLRPSFTDFPFGIIRTVCPHIVILQDTFNNNILSKGIVDNSLHTKSKQPHKLFVINNEIQHPAAAGRQDDKKQEQTIVRLQKKENQDYQQKIRRAKQKNIPPAMLSSIFFFTDLAWNFVRSLLYENRPFMPEQEQATKQYIAGYFLEYVKNNNPRTISQCYTEFITTIQIINDYTKRKVEWNIARPEYFFDPNFTGGFHRAFNEWLPKHKDRQKNNKEWNTNKKLVAQLYRYYSADPTFERFRQCTQRLGKLKNKKFLDTFNTCILDKDKYNNQFLNQQN
jgi:hypothetical protein